MSSTGMADLVQILAENVRAARKRAGMSQEDLAAAAAVDRTYVSGIERGLRNPTIKIVDKFAAALGTDASNLLTKNHR
jgi:transcriptional regulator with XRE-family HTH domain